MNRTFDIRKREDLLKLKALQQKLGKALEIVRVCGDPPRDLSLRIRVPTAKNGNYPRELQASSEVLIQLPQRYPLDMPLVTFTTPIWNPNIFSSGRWCFGEWKITENLELFVLRLIKAIALDPSIINLKSPANTDAAAWYQRKLTAEPGLFPTIPVANLFGDTPKKNLIWRELR